MHVAQSCLTLCNPMDYTVHGILQARVLDWVAIPSLGDLPGSGIKPVSPALAGGFLTIGPPGKSLDVISKAMNWKQLSLPEIRDEHAA